MLDGRVLMACGEKELSDTWIGDLTGVSVRTGDGL
jgi:uncharacterized lipoprotein YehR (DUF1307 family)